MSLNHFLNIHIRIENTRLQQTRWMITFCVFFLFCFGMALPALSYPMAYDDLHLIRSFSPQELRAAFVNTYDSDGFENPGFRPIMTLFNHTRYQFFGEQVITHRLFMITMSATFYTMMTWIATRIGMPWMTAIFVNLLSCCSKYNTYHYIWLTDGIFLFQGCLFGMATVFLLLWLDSDRISLFVSSIISLFIALLTREDTIAFIPIIILIGFYYRQNHARRTSITRLYLFVVITIAYTILFFVLRHILTPNALGVGLNVQGLFLHLLLSFNIMGMIRFNSVSYLFILLWTILLIMLIVGLLITRIPFTRRQSSLLWLGCTVSACAPGLTVTRVNLLMFSTTFAMLFIGSILTDFKLRPWQSHSLMTVLLIGTMYISSVQIQSFHPYNLQTIMLNGEFIYGQYAQAATIPPGRRAQVVQQLAQVQITSASDLQGLPHAFQAAVQADIRTPQSVPQPFAAYCEWFSY